MFTGIGALFGIAGSAINRGLSIYETKQQAKIDSEKRSDEFEMAKLSASKETNIASYTHDTSLAINTSTWVNNIRALVRPSITAYAFVFLTWVYFASTLDIQAQIAMALVELVNTVVAWWFADRFKK
jgi:hypothetical protein